MKEEKRMMRKSGKGGGEGEGMTRKGGRGGENGWER